MVTSTEEHVAERRVQVLVIGLAAVMAAAAWMAPAAGAAAPARPGVPAPASFSARGFLDSVAATSARNAWAVGQAGPAFSSKPRTLIARWDGTAWKPVPSPNPAGGGSLYGVTVTSARSGWAVGESGSATGTRTKTLILHWNGATWSQVPSPTPAGGGTLYGVTAASARSAWAVGWAYRGSKTLILHWNGTVWTRVPSPTPAGGAILSSVAATSASSAWAVGWASFNPNAKTLILRWNGTAWTRVPSPDPVGSSALGGVEATSASSPWAVGCTACGSRNEKTLVVRWNGTAWTQVPSPTPAGGAFLNAVTATSASSAWAVGATGSGAGLRHKTLILRWNGTTWTRLPSPSPAGGAILFAVAATSGPNAWAVGQTGTYSTLNPTTVDLHWNGTTWK
jgi:hypothetical protein